MTRKLLKSENAERDIGKLKVIPEADLKYF